MFNFSDEENLKVIIKLNRNTINGKIKWIIVNPDVVVFEFDAQVVGKVYRTPINGKYFQLFKYKYRSYSPDFDETYWASDIRLEISDSRGVQEWEFPSDRSLKDLYENVRLKTGEVDELLSSFLNKD